MSSFAENPTIIFATGAWHTTQCFDLVREKLTKVNWPTEAVSYPSVGAEPPTKGLADDAAAVRATIEKLAGEGKQVVLVVHSYGGLVGANAVEGLGFAERQAKGEKGGVILFVYLAAFVTPMGGSIKQMLGGQFLPWMNFQGDTGYVHADDPKQIFYHDVEGEQLEQALSTLKHQSAPVFTDVVSYEPWHKIECLYMICEEDKALPAFIQEGMAKSLGESSQTVRIKASHSPFLSQPDAVVDGLVSSTKVVLERI
ncbi:Alpha/beta hydrolase fold-1 [Pseudomassariella vexata]|uniref:Alpha/beta hydrolase fold-1 n=1 Tax=Pseudomassariella vexata TaxID=1141098 RepID=A0A1Y2DIC9_9PEZI|nr:Alpha/beta hydrolase fold-1 [Pseudomassariella vexata]ORY58904.1 Alpha/beta hydrolase fold-1 [Pseudomassariella vexata]